MSILDQITSNDLIEFGINLNIMNIGTDGDRLFPNMKTQYLEAEYMRLSKSPSLPHAAMVHGYDTEAYIGKRRTADVVRIEQLLIKEKLNLSERESRLLSRVNRPSDIINYIYDDIGNLGRAVRTRAEVAKFEAFCTGKMTIKENNVDLEIDYGVPDENRKELNWTSADADILGDLRKIVSAGKRMGQRYTHAMTSQKILDMMLQNTQIQKAVNGALMQGVIITLSGLNNLLNTLFGFTVSVNDDWYEFEKADGRDCQARLFDEDKFILYVGDRNGAVGTGLWGVTPEENDARSGGSAVEGGAYNNFVYFTRWKTPDPVAVWTKASGVFVPVLPNPNGHVICTIKGAKELKLLNVSTTASSSTANGSVVTISPKADNGNSFVYKAAAKVQDVEAGKELNGWTSIKSGDEIVVSASSNTKLTVAEINADNKIIGAGNADINKKA